MRRNPLADVASAGIVLSLIVTALTACDVKPAPTPAAGASAAPTGAPPAVVLIEELRKVAADPAPLKYSLAENVTFAAAADSAPLAGFKPFMVTADAKEGMHRIGLQLPAGAGDTTYLITTWIKTAPGTDAMFELASLGQDNKVIEYAVSYFNMAQRAVAPNVVVTAETQMKDVIIAAEGEWTKISGSMKSSNQNLAIVIGLVKGATHVFQGTGAETLTVGGVSISSMEAGRVATSPVVEPFRAAQPLAPAAQPESTQQ